MGLTKIEDKGLAKNGQERCIKDRKLPSGGFVERFTNTERDRVENSNLEWRKRSMRDT